MRITKYLVLLPLMISLGCSYNKKQEDSVEKLEISDIDVDNLINISEICDTILYIPLETTGKSLVKSCYNAKVSDSNIYISGTRSGLKVFSLDGKFRFKINKSGRGPGEFEVFTTYDVNKKGDILVIDNGNRKILFFDSKGQFIKEKHTDLYIDHFSWFNGDIITRNFTGEEYNFTVYDENFKIKSEYLKREDDLVSFYYSGGQCFFAKKKEELFFTYILNYNVYKLKGDQFEKSLNIDFNELNLPDNLFKPASFTNYRANMDLYDKISETKYVNSVYNYSESDRQRFFMFSMKDRYCMCFQDLKTKKYQVGLLTNDIDLVGMGVYVCANEKYIVYQIQAYELKLNFEKLKKKYGKQEWSNYLNKRPQLRNLYENIKEDDNPILIVGRFK